MVAEVGGGVRNSGCRVNTVLNTWTSPVPICTGLRDYNDLSEELETIPACTKQPRAITLPIVCGSGSARRSFSNRRDNVNQTDIETV